MAAIAAMPITHRSTQNCESRMGPKRAMKPPEARLDSMPPAYTSPMNTPIHFGVMPRSCASTGASTAGVVTASDVKTWMAVVATKATTAMRVPPGGGLFLCGAHAPTGLSKRCSVITRSTAKSCGAAGRRSTTCRSKAPATRGTCAATEASKRS